MPSKIPTDRPRIAQKIAAAKHIVAQSVSDQFFLQHPDWLVRHGERGRQFCTDDTRFHLEFLCGALESGSPESFADYSRWTGSMLAARGIANDSLAENFERIGHHLSAIVSGDEYLEVSTFLSCGVTASLHANAIAETCEPDNPLRLTQEVYLAAILSGQRQTAVTVVEEALRAGVSLVDLYVDVFAEALHRVGKLWETNKITVAQEHLATAITQYTIAAVYPKLVSSGPRLGRMIVTGVCGELHQIGANLVADAMESRGWNVQFLGSNMPHGSIIQAIEESSADVQIGRAHV